MTLQSAIRSALVKAPRRTALQLAHMVNRTVEDVLAALRVMVVIDGDVTVVLGSSPRLYVMREVVR
jgi:hypothetical protein